MKSWTKIGSRSACEARGVLRFYYYYHNSLSFDFIFFLQMCHNFTHNCNRSRAPDMPYTMLASHIMQVSCPWQGLAKILAGDMRVITVQAPADTASGRGADRYLS